MADPIVLTNQLLIAMPTLRDPNFARGVTFVCQHGAEGAMGLLINRLSEYRLGDVLAQMGMHSDLAEVVDAPVLIGGPVQPERGLVCVTTSRDVLVAIAAGKGPRHALVALGYSGWSPGQLEQELCENHWLVAPATERVLFETPLEERWEAAAGLVGVNLMQLANYAGHA